MAADPNDWDVKYRPSKLEDVIGQSDAVSVVSKWSKVPRCVMFHGPSGCGKTTLARIVVSRLLKVNDIDLHEINCGVVESSIEMVRDIDRNLTAAPLGDARVYVLDEVQCLSRQKYAQEALLKVLEECPEWVRFILCTTDPQRLLASIRNRCERVAVSSVTPKDLRKLAERVAKAERIDPPLDDRVLDKLAESSKGCVRDVLKQLQKVARLEDNATRASAIGGVAEDKGGFDLACALMPFKGSPDWPSVAKVLNELTDTDPESVRQIVLNIARTHLIKANSSLAPQAYKVIRCMSDPLYDRNAGNAVLAAMCYQILHGKG